MTTALLILVALAVQWAMHEAYMRLRLPEFEAARSLVEAQRSYILAIEKDNRAMREAAMVARDVNVVDLDDYRRRGRKDGAS